MSVRDPQTLPTCPECGQPILSGMTPDGVCADCDMPDIAPRYVIAETHWEAEARELNAQMAAEAKWELRLDDDGDDVVWDHVPGDDDADMPPAQRGTMYTIEDIDDLPF